MSTMIDYKVCSENNECKTVTSISNYKDIITVSRTIFNIPDGKDCVLIDPSNPLLDLTSPSAVIPQVLKLIIIHPHHSTLNSDSNDGTVGNISNTTDSMHLNIFERFIAYPQPKQIALLTDTRHMLFLKPHVNSFLTTFGNSEHENILLQKFVNLMSVVFDGNDMRNPHEFIPWIVTMQTIDAHPDTMFKISNLARHVYNEFIKVYPCVKVDSKLQN